MSEKLVKHRTRRTPRAGAAPRDGAPSTPRPGASPALLAGLALVAGTLTGLAVVVAGHAPDRSVARVDEAPADVDVAGLFDTGPSSGPVVIADHVPPPAPAPTPRPAPAIPSDPAHARAVELAVTREVLPEPGPPRWDDLALLPRDDRPRGPVRLPDVTRPGAALGEPDAAPATSTSQQDGQPVNDDDEEADDLPPVVAPPPATRDADAPPTAAGALDTGSPVALALRQLLHVPHTLRDGRVEARYRFNGPDEVGDFEWTGFDKLEVGEVVGRNLRTVDLELGVGSRRVGRLVHVVPLAGDFRIDLAMWVNQATSRSDLVLFVGDKVGVRWGQQIVRASRSGGLRPVAGAQPDRGLFREERLVRVRLTRTGDALTVECDGRRVAHKAFKPGELDGRFGLIAQDVRVVITELSVDGVVDPAKL